MQRKIFSAGIVLVVALMAGLVLGMAQTSPFAGKWKIKLVPDDDARAAKQKDSDDTLTFTATTFMAEQFGAKNGFKAAPYEEDTRRMGPASFTSESKSDTAGTAKWTGTITSTVIKGTLTWTQKDGTVLNYTYTGEKAGN